MPLMPNLSRLTTRKSLRAAKIVALLVPVALLLPISSARAADEPPPGDDVFRRNTNEVLQGAAARAGAGCQGGPGTATVLGLLMHGDRLHLWKLEQSDKAPELRPNVLAKVKDSTGVMVDDSAFEPEAYCEALLKA